MSRCRIVLVAANGLSSDRDVLVVSVACMVFLFNLFAVSTLGFLLNIDMSWLNAIISLMLTLIFVALQSAKKVLAVTATIVLISLPIAIVSFYYDRSYDGNAYHKLSVGLIASGWNPVYEQFDTFANQTGRFLRTEWSGFYDGYPKASYIIGAALYALTGNIESGKAFTLISMIAAGGSIAVFTKRIGNLKCWQSVAVALSVCINTISVGEMLTFYNDAFLAMCIFCVIFALLFLCSADLGSYHLCTITLIFTAATLGLNLKFSSVFILGGIASVFMALSLYLKKSGNSSVPASARSPGKTLGFIVTTACIGFGVLGSSSYIHNLFYYGNPLFPFGVDDNQKTLASALPDSLEGLPPIRQFIGSLFSRVSMEASFKIPFSMNETEIRQSVESVWKLAGGWGIWFSGILLLSLLAYLSIARRVSTKLNVAFLAIFLGSFLPAFWLPLLNNARYWPLILLIPPFVLFALFTTASLNARRTILFAAILSANVALPVGGILVWSKLSWDVHRELGEMAISQAGGQRMIVSLGGADPIEHGELPRAFDGLIFNLDDAGIHNFIQIAPAAIGKLEPAGTLVEFSYNSEGSPIGIFYVASGCVLFMSKQEGCVS